MPATLRLTIRGRQRIETCPSLDRVREYQEHASSNPREAIVAGNMYVPCLRELAPGKMCVSGLRQLGLANLHVLLNWNKILPLFLDVLYGCPLAVNPVYRNTVADFPPLKNTS